jgi:hypothetical protein
MYVPPSIYAEPRPPAPRNVILGDGQPVVSSCIDGGHDAGDGPSRMPQVQFSTSVTNKMHQLGALR